MEAIGKRNEKLLTPTITPTREVFTRIDQYMRCRVELNILLSCLEQLRPSMFAKCILTTKRNGTGYLPLSVALEQARLLAPDLKADEIFQGLGSCQIFLSRAAERFGAWRSPRDSGRQGKNIEEFLRVLYRAEQGDEAGGHLLVREGRGESAGFRVFPGQLLLQVITFLAERVKRNGSLLIPGGGKLVLHDIEEHFSVYGIDFSLAADARPMLINELQGLGLLNGSPDSGSSVAVMTPF